MNTSQIIAAVKRCTEAELRVLSRKSGVPLPTLAKIRYAQTTDPRSSTVDKLRRHLERAA